jgi:anti-sigma B factor antagonist
MKQLEVKKEKDVAIINVVGELEFSNSEQFDNSVKSLLRENFIKIVINFSQANYIDSSGLGVLIGALKSANQAQGDVRLCSLDENLKDVFKMTRLLNHFKIFNSEKEALASFD